MIQILVVALSFVATQAAAGLAFACAHMNANVEQTINITGFGSYNLRVIHGNFGGDSAYANAKRITATFGSLLIAANVTGCKGFNCPTSPWFATLGHKQWVSANLGTPGFLIVQSGYETAEAGIVTSTCRTPL
jgi:hypothetical protein